MRPGSSALRPCVPACLCVPQVVPPEELGVSFDSIGALENVKETLREVVMLPLQRPEVGSGRLAWG